MSETLFESRDTINPRSGVARNWRIGPMVIEWYVELPPQSWLTFDSNLSIRVFSEEDTDDA